MIIDTWHAAKPRQGLLAEVAPGIEILTKFCMFVKFFEIDLGSEAFILNQFSSESTKLLTSIIFTFYSLSVHILSLIAKTTNITENHIGQRPFKYILQTLKEHDFHCQLTL